MPIYAPGSDIRPITDHMFDAIWATPSSFMLTAAKRSAERITIDHVSPSWFDSYSVAQGGCATPRQYADGTPAACDEYPFLASEEGGPPASGVLAPQQLRFVPSAANSFEGTLRAGFYATCNMTVPPRHDPERRFLVVPMAGQDSMPTIAFCGR